MGLKPRRTDHRSALGRTKTASPPTRSATLARIEPAFMGVIMDTATRNPSITSDSRSAVEALDRFAAQPDVLAALHGARAHAEARLRDSPELEAASVTLDPILLGWSAPEVLGSIRVSVTRTAGGDAFECHANSTQYLLVLDGPVETHVETPSGWRIDRYGLGGSVELHDRWHVIAPGVWHKTVAPDASYWGIVAFHSARETSDEYR